MKNRDPEIYLTNGRCAVGLDKESDIVAVFEGSGLVTLIVWVDGRFAGMP